MGTPECSRPFGPSGLCYTGLGLLCLWVGGINGWTILYAFGLMLVFGIANYRVRCPKCGYRVLQITLGHGRRSCVRSVVSRRDSRRPFETDPLLIIVGARDRRMACDIIDSYAITTSRDPRHPRDQLSRRLHARGARRARGAGAARRRSQGGDGGAHRPARGARARSSSASRSSIRSRVIPRTQIKVQDARDGKFVGSEIPGDLAAPVDSGHRPGGAGRTRRSKRASRNVAYALLSGADGWMFDGEDALGQVSTMSLDNQRNLKLAIHRDPVFLEGRRAGGRRDEHVGDRVLRPRDHRRLAEAARLHDQDLPRPRPAPRRSARPARRRRRLLRVDRRC